MFHPWNTFIDKEENFTWEYFLSSPLWMNKTIKIENKPRGRLKKKDLRASKFFEQLAPSKFHWPEKYRSTNGPI